MTSPPSSALGSPQRAQLRPARGWTIKTIALINRKISQCNLSELQVVSIPWCPSTNTPNCDSQRVATEVNSRAYKNYFKWAKKTSLSITRVGFMDYKCIFFSLIRNKLVGRRGIGVHTFCVSHLGSCFEEFLAAKVSQQARCIRLACLAALWMSFSLWTVDRAIFVLYMRPRKRWMSWKLLHKPGTSFDIYRHAKFYLRTSPDNRSERCDVIGPEQINFVKTTRASNSSFRLIVFCERRTLEVKALSIRAY